MWKLALDFKLAFFLLVSNHCLVSSEAANRTARHRVSDCPAALSPGLGSVRYGTDSDENMKERESIRMHTPICSKL